MFIIRNPLWPLCTAVSHLFNCSKLNTKLMIMDLGTDSVEVVKLLSVWDSFQSNSKNGCRTRLRPIEGLGGQHHQLYSK